MTCAFCAIVRGVEDARDLIRWQDVASFTPLNPVVEGHRLFVPAMHVSDVFQEPMVSALTLAKLAEWGFGRGDANVITSSGPTATQTVGHLHFHYVPRHDGDGLSLPWSPR